MAEPMIDETKNRRRLATAISLIIAFGIGAYACSSFSLRGGVDGPVISSGFLNSGDGEDAQIFGTVAIEGPCLYLESPEDRTIRYPVVWPMGTKWQSDPPAVILPGGDEALVGMTVSGGGGYHQPERVSDLAGSAGAGLAEQCALDPYREVAIFNPGSKVTLQE
jgi:hypothetical protein